MGEANPRNIATIECAPTGARGTPATPAGVRIVVSLLPGARFAHPWLISFRPAGAEYVTVFVNYVLPFRAAGPGSLSESQIS